MTSTERFNKIEQRFIERVASNQNREVKIPVTVDTIPKLQEAFKSKWLEYLRSGKYQQGRGSLIHTSRNGDVKYCCLGVACRAVTDMFPGILIWEYDMIYLPERKNAGHGAYPPQVIVDRKMFREYGDRFPKDMTYAVGMALANINDDDSFRTRPSFPEIADLIEKWL